MNYLEGLMLLQLYSNGEIILKLVNVIILLSSSIKAILRKYIRVSAWTYILGLTSLYYLLVISLMQDFCEAASLLEDKPTMEVPSTTT